MPSASTSPAATISRSLLRHIAPGSSSGTAPSWVRRRMRTGALFRATCCAKPGLRTEDVSADDLDLDCSAAATDVLNRARDEELLIASLESSLKVSQAVAAALTAMADERAGEPSRKARRIRLVHEDSVATVEKHFRDYRHLYNGRAVFRRAAGSHQEAVARQAPGSRS